MSSPNSSDEGSQSSDRSYISKRRRIQDDDLRSDGQDSPIRASSEDDSPLSPSFTSAFMSVLGLDARRAATGSDSSTVGEIDEDEYITVDRPTPSSEPSRESSPEEDDPDEWVDIGYKSSEGGSDDAPQVVVQDDTQYADQDSSIGEGPNPAVDIATAIKALEETHKAFLREYNVGQSEAGRSLRELLHLLSVRFETNLNLLTRPDIDSKIASALSVPASVSQDHGPMANTAPPGLPIPAALAHKYRHDGSLVSDELDFSGVDFAAERGNLRLTEEDLAERAARVTEAQETLHIARANLVQGFETGNLTVNPKCLPSILRLQQMVVAVEGRRRRTH